MFVIDSRDLRRWQTDTIDYREHRGLVSTVCLAHIARGCRLRAGQWLPGMNVLINAVIQKSSLDWCSSRKASGEGGLCLWRGILDSLPWESSKLCCAQWRLSSPVCVRVFLCVCGLESARWAVFLSLYPLSPDLSSHVTFSFFFTLWNVQFCAPGVGLCAPSRWGANSFVVKPQRDGFLHRETECKQTVWYVAVLQTSEIWAVFLRKWGRRC